MSRGGAATLRLRRKTYGILATTALLALAASAPQLLGAIGLIGEESLQGWMTLAGMFFGVPAMLLALAAAVLTLVGWWHGPWGFRTRLAAWWLIGAGGVFLSQAIAADPTFNPYLGSPQPPFGRSDAILLVGLVAAVVLPIVWVSRPGAGATAAADH